MKVHCCMGWLYVGSLLTKLRLKVSPGCSAHMTMEVRGVAVLTQMCQNVNYFKWTQPDELGSCCLLNKPECAVTKSPRKRASVRKLTTKRPCSLMRMLVGYREPKNTFRYPQEPIYSLYSLWGAMEPTPAIPGQHPRQVAIKSSI